jgi:Transcriptional regulatory protein, C terminal
MSKVRDLLTRRAAHGIVGRTREVTHLFDLFTKKAPLVVHLHGITGIGKSTLLDAFAGLASKRNIKVIRCDCRLIEPTERGFLHELGTSLGIETHSLKKLAGRLGKVSRRVVIALDHYEVFRLLDTWLRQVFVPALGDNIRVLLAGREPPSTAWTIAREWQGLFHSLMLAPLTPADSTRFLLRAGVTKEDSVYINRLARGHPLALKIAASAALEHSGFNLKEAGVQNSVQDLTRAYLADIKDADVRRALEAASVVRRITRPILNAMLRDVPPDLYERLRTTPLVESRPDGFMLHDAVRGTIAAALQAADPIKFREYGRAAWRQLRGEVRRAGPPDLWRYTADLIYLIENPVVREAFFPSESQQFSVEPAVDQDGESIHRLAKRHESNTAMNAIDFWWDNYPQAFHVVRDTTNKVVGFYCMFDPSGIRETLFTKDPIVFSWWRHLRDHGVQNDEKVLFLRRWLSWDDGESPSPVQAACWLDIKRIYMELRPNLRRVYLTVRDLMTYAPVALKLGFSPLSECDGNMDGNTYRTAMLDFGPSSVDGWISGLVAAELGMEEEKFLDTEARELVLDGARVNLTKLEFDVLHYLSQNNGKAISRDLLLDDVWGQTYHGGSNVVDVVIRALRKKIGPRADMIETVRGMGYRFRSN